MLEMFGGMLRLSECEDGIVLQATVPLEGEDDGRVGAFTLAFKYEKFRTFIKRSAQFIDMVEPETHEAAPVGEGEIPYGDEGACPNCDAVEGIRAGGNVRNCMNCQYVWKVRA